MSVAESFKSYKLKKQHQKKERNSRYYDETVCRPRQITAIRQDTYWKQNQRARKKELEQRKQKNRQKSKRYRERTHSKYVNVNEINEVPKFNHRMTKSREMKKLNAFLPKTPKRRAQIMHFCQKRRAQILSAYLGLKSPTVKTLEKIK